MSKLTFKNFPMSLDDKTYHKWLEELYSFSVDLSAWKSAVNVIIADEKIFLIHRSNEVPTHKGQIGLPGGGKNPGESVWEAAKREFNEETGIDESKLTPLGLLPPVFTGAKSLMIPCVSYCSEIEQAVSNGEWDNGLMVPLKALAKIDDWQQARRHSDESKGYILFRPLQKSEFHLIQSSKEKELKAPLLWGATARVIWNLFRFGL